MARILLTIFCLLVFMSCVQERPESHASAGSPEHAVLEKLVAAYYAGMSQRDWQKYRGYFRDNATITTAWQQPGDATVKVHVVKIDEFIEKTPEGPDSQPVFSEQMKNASIEVKDHPASTRQRLGRI